MKKRLLAIAAMVVATASTAYAAPGLGASGNNAVPEGPAPLFALFASVFSFTEIASGPSHDSRPNQQRSSYQCPDGEYADEEKEAGPDAKRSASGPEPVYLAF